MRTPLGLYDGAFVSEGIAPHGGSRIGGPLGTGADHARDGSAATAESLATPFRAPVSVGTSFVLGSDTFRLLRVDVRWRQGLDEIRVPPQYAAAILEEAAKQQWEAEIGALLETAASRLAGLDDDGVFLLLRKQRLEGAAPSGAQTARSSTPSSFRPPAPPELSPVVEEPAMGALQAAVLRDAAARGVPFCEECARAAAPGGSSAA